MVLDSTKRAGLRFFFAFSGCDQVSFFAHISKATAWEVWIVFPEVSVWFVKLSNHPNDDDIASSACTGMVCCVAVPSNLKLC